MENKRTYSPTCFGQVASTSGIKFKIQRESYMIFTLRFI